MRSLSFQVAENVRRRALLPRGTEALVAVSGGLDSMVLLHLLHEQAARHDWRLTVAHFNHQLRGRASDGDARFVAAAALRLQLPCECGGGDVRAEARRSGESLEMAARKLRHAFLARTAREQDCPRVVLAHHADDQVELFFLRLLRGASAEGLAGMDWSNPSPADAEITLIRPLLATPKSVLRQEAEARGLRFREDASNARLDILRNRLRHELLPLLRASYQPGLDAIVGRLTETLGAQADCIGEAVKRWRRTNKPAFGRLPVAVQRAWLAEELLAMKREPDFTLIERLRSEPSRPVEVGPGERIQRVRVGHHGDKHESLQILRAKPARASGEPSQAHPLRLPVSQAQAKARVVFGGVEFTLRDLRGCSLPARQKGTEYFDADVVGAAVVLRHWRPGDRFQPLGLPAPAKLQDLFTNAKVPREERHRRVLLATDAGCIIWVEGLRLGEPAKVTSTTRRRLRMTWRRLAE